MSGGFPRPPASSPWSGDAALAGAVLDALPDATAVLDRSGTIIAVNHAWRMFALDNGGTEASTGPGVNYLEVCARSAAAGSRDAAEVAGQLHAVLAGECLETELEYPCPSPTVGRWFLLRVTRLAGPVPGVVVSHVNITRRKAAESELAHAASHDPLTGLANRTLLNRSLAAALRPRSGRHHNAATPRAWSVGVICIDLNGFKPVNDTYGHSAGDEVLITVAHRLTALLRPSDTAGRPGGDEFAVIAPRTDRAGLAALADRIDRALAEPHHLHGRAVEVPGAVGTHLAQAGDDPAEAWDLADRAMYSVKRSR